MFLSLKRRIAFNRRGLTLYSSTSACAGATAEFEANAPIRPEVETMAEARVSPRERLLLTAIIEMYIATGEPVASQAVARFFADRDGLSSATIRNVMVSL